MRHYNFKKNIGLYDPRFEHDGCGVGFVCDIKGIASYDIVSNGLEVLHRMSHRGAVGADPKTGDGAGILIQLPHRFFKEACPSLGISLPEKGDYAAGLVFMPQDKGDRETCQEIFERIVKQEGLEILGWRQVPVDGAAIGKTARKTMPFLLHVFIKRSDKFSDELSFERKLYVIRRLIEKDVYESSIQEADFFYITNLSSRTLSYKGLLMPEQLKDFFLDLKDERIQSSLCLVHSRYSTNTFPAWDLSQPFRFLAHNGEINTLRGNINWMKAREAFLENDLFGDDIDKIKPIIIPNSSDSASLDNMFELLVLSGRSLLHSMMMLIPSAWQKDDLMDKKLKDFYKYHSCLMEPWDGPAAVAFTDGHRIGASLDRNGLRPCRYIITKDGLLVMASEVGVLDIPSSDIKVSARLEPGKFLYIDTVKGEFIDSNAIKNEICQNQPYGKWLKKHMVNLDSLKASCVPEKINDEEYKDLLKVFGYTREDLKVILGPMAETGVEPIGSMGNDTPHAVLSQQPQILYNYFKQLFAQVTNPAIDPIREEVVMSLETGIGPQLNILAQTPEHAHLLYVKNPVLTDDELAKIKGISVNGFRAKTISLLYELENSDLEAVIERVCNEAEGAVKEGYSFVVLSDRGVNKDYAAVSSLLAIGSVHHRLVSKGLRTRAGLIVETAEVREVHHFAVLFGYGADCVNPYLAYAIVRNLVSEEKVNVSQKQAVENYINAVNKGILKILSKMGISTLQSYRGAQIFEALGIDEEVVNKCFCGTVTRIGGVGFKEINTEILARHKEAFSKNPLDVSRQLNTGGIYQWKRDGEIHLWNPETIALLQDSAHSDDYEKYKEFSKLINEQGKTPVTLRSLLKFKKGAPLSIDKVESIESIMKRFVTGAMSFGSISRGAHETLALAMNRIKGQSNTGEGGEDPARFNPTSNGDSKRSAIKQVASGRFGVTANYLVNADEIQIKISQGAKPGEGGQLPGHKVSELIARIRYTTPGVTLISPPPHHDIYSIEDLAQLIFDLKNVNPRARISVKLVSEPGVGTVAAGVAKAHADMILISGGDGGTGASPRTSIRHAGLPWELGLSETHQTLVMNDLRARVRLQTDGQMRTGRDVAIAALLGAEEYGFCSAALVVMGCVMLRHCHLNNCSLGVATQDELLERRFNAKVEYVVNYFSFIAREVREIMAELGIGSIDEMIGRTDLLSFDKNESLRKGKLLDYSKILYKPSASSSKDLFCTSKQDHGIDDVLDKDLIKQCEEAFAKGNSVNLSFNIRNYNRTAGAMLSGEVCRLYGEEGLPMDTIKCRFNGVAGQSFGAFLAKGITFELEGIANDYVGKGISGGKIVIYPDKTATYKACENIIIGNTSFYGAISGEAYIRGLAGERFAIRNSGLYAVVEGVGDHGCEYMTGGRVVVLGKTGRNFAAGMSGGIAYVYDETGSFSEKCN
ncbi:MAG: glutamate synthase large subunit, partial [Candidatus Omnitrophota bacterium]